MRKVFVWDSLNLDHIAKHDVTLEEARDVVESASRPYPQLIGGGKWLVRGRTPAGRALQVIFLLLDDEEVDVSELSLEDRIKLAEGERAVYVIHARDLTERERRRLRKRP